MSLNMLIFLLFNEYVVHLFLKKVTDAQDKCRTFSVKIFFFHVNTGIPRKFTLLILTIAAQNQQGKFAWDSGSSTFALHLRHLFIFSFLYISFFLKCSTHVWNLFFLYFFLF